MAPVGDRGTTALACAAVGSAVLVFLGVYLTSAGHGFISDDFGWILSSRLRSATDWPRLFLTSDGFYRPLVGISFAADYALFGMRPFGYGLTNVGLAMLCGVLIHRLLRALRFPHGAATLGAILWLLNVHGINMAILWTSGRTALLVVAMSVATAIAVVRQRIAAGVLCLLAALFSKEEAVLLPAVLAGWQAFLTPQWHFSTALRIKSAVGAALALTVYFALRMQTTAMTPANAPYYYRFTFEPAHVTRNFLEYLDRTFTYPAIVTLLALVLLGRGALTTVRWDVVKCAVVWILGGFGLTLFVPGRSSLYVCLPSVGSALMAATVCSNLWSTATQASRRRALIVAVLIPLVSAPLYVARNRRYVDLAEFSARALDDMTRLTADLPDGSPVVIVDDKASRLNVTSAFGTLLEHAYELHAGRRLPFWVEPPIPEAEESGLHRPCPRCDRRQLAVSDGRLVRADHP